MEIYGLTAGFEKSNCGSVKSTMDSGVTKLPIVTPVKSSVPLNDALEITSGILPT
jgi:hypothetical protein